MSAPWEKTPPIANSATSDVIYVKDCEMLDFALNVGIPLLFFCCIIYLSLRDRQDRLVVVDALPMTQKETKANNSFV